MEQGGVEWVATLALKVENCLATRMEPHCSQATGVSGPAISFSKADPHCMQRYSNIGMGFLVSSAAVYKGIIRAWKQETVVQLLREALVARGSARWLYKPPV